MSWHSLNFARRCSRKGALKSVPTLSRRAIHFSDVGVAENIIRDEARRGLLTDLSSRENNAWITSFNGLQPPRTGIVGSHRNPRALQVEILPPTTIFLASGKWFSFTRSNPDTARNMNNPTVGGGEFMGVGSCSVALTDRTPQRVDSLSASRRWAWVERKTKVRYQRHAESFSGDYKPAMVFTTNGKVASRRAGDFLCWLTTGSVMPVKFRMRAESCAGNSLSNPSTHITAPGIGSRDGGGLAIVAPSPGLNRCSRQRQCLERDLIIA